MTQRQTVLERAFQLARSGACAGVGEIKLKLKGEGYMDVDGQLYGRSLVKQLREVCQAAKAEGQRRE